MSSARLARHPGVRKGAAVSAGVLALCLGTAGTSYADTPVPLPPIPSPGNVITTLDQTVTQVTGTDPGLAPPSTTTPPPTPGTTTPTTVTKRPAAKASTTTVRPAKAAKAGLAPAPADPASSVTWSTPAATGELTLPPATTVSTVAGAAPAVAPLLIPQVTQQISPAAAMLEADKHTGSPVRGILLGLAIAAAVGLGYEHLRLARRGVPG
jgi:hypothetical protein